VEVAKKELEEREEEAPQLLTPEALKLIAELCIKYLHVAVPEAFLFIATPDPAEGEKDDKQEA
jgi:hypothetical protein